MYIVNYCPFFSFFYKSEVLWKNYLKSHFGFVLLPFFLEPIPIMFILACLSMAGSWGCFLFLTQWPILNPQFTFIGSILDSYSFISELLYPFGFLIFFLFFPVFPVSPHLVQNVHEYIWFMEQIVLDRAKYQGPFDVDQISPWTFWIGPNTTNYQQPFGINQIFYGNFEQDHMVLKWSFLVFQQIFIQLFLCAK